MTVPDGEWPRVLSKTDKLLLVGERNLGPKGWGWLNDSEKSRLDREKATILYVLAFLPNQVLLHFAGGDGYPATYERRVSLGNLGPDLVVKKMRTMRPDAASLEGQVAGEGTIADRKSDPNFDDDRIRGGRVRELWKLVRKLSLDELVPLEEARGGRLFLLAPRLISAAEMGKTLELSRLGNQDAKAYVEFLARLRKPGLVSVVELTVRHRADLEQRLALYNKQINETNRRADEKMWANLFLAMLRMGGK